MSAKITWRDIYKDFRQRHPNLSKGAHDYRPYDYLTIRIWFKDGSVMLYDYGRKRATFLKHADTPQNEA